MRVKGRLLNKQSRQFAKEQIDLAPDGYEYSITPPKRTNPQNNLLHSVISDIAEQVVWYGKLYGIEDWKDILTAALLDERVVPGINGKFVILGHRTRDMDTEQISDLIELSRSFGIAHDVEFKIK